MRDAEMRAAKPRVRPLADLTFIDGLTNALDSHNSADKNLKNLEAFEL